MVVTFFPSDISDVGGQASFNRLGRGQGQHRQEDHCLGVGKPLRTLLASAHLQLNLSVDQLIREGRPLHQSNHCYHGVPVIINNRIKLFSGQLLDRLVLVKSYFIGI